MADTSISGNVTVHSDVKERVALDLMLKIDYYTGDVNSRKDEKYWYQLYHRCHCLVVNGWTPEDTMQG